MEDLRYKLVLLFVLLLSPETDVLMMLTAARLPMLLESDECASDVVLVVAHPVERRCVYCCVEPFPCQLV